MTKDELRQQAEKYDKCSESAKVALEHGNYAEAVAAAVRSLSYVDDMMRFRQKYEDESFASVETIDVILKYAPLLLDGESLDQLGVVLKADRRIDREATDDLAARLEGARQLLRDTHRLWNHLERHEDVRQDALRVALGGEHARWRALVQQLEEVGLVTRRSDAGTYLIWLNCRMNSARSGKCPKCGLVSVIQLIDCYAARECESCGASALFVVVDDAVN